MSKENLRSSQLSFDFLDDLALASVRRHADPYLHLKTRRISRIGPLFEFISHHRANSLPFDALPLCQVRDTLSLAFSPKYSAQGSHFEGTNTLVGFAVTIRDPNASDQVQWTAFCRKAQQAGELSLPKPVAQALVGVMREMEDNVHIHSDRSRDGIVGYRSTPEEFELAVMDSGIGVLESLRKSPDFQSLTDSGTALKIAVEDGQSRLRYQDSGRGYGFHGLFVGLANLNAELRFRSGDHVLTINGTSPSLLTAQLSQKIQIPGFLVNVVCCVKPAQTLF